jgi:cytochrome P450
MLPHMQKGPHAFFLRTALEHGGVAQLGRPDRLLVTHPEGIKHVLLDHQHNYIKGKYAERLRLLIGNGLPVSDGEFWLRQRHLMQPAFHRQRLASLATVITDTIASMLQRWQATAARDRPRDIAMEMRRLAQESIVKTMFGVDIGIEEADRLGRAFTVVTEYIGYRSSAVLPMPMHWRTPRNHSFQIAQQRIDQAVYSFINKRRQRGIDGADIISMLLAARDEETGAGMSDAQVCDEVRTIFFAGYETTSSALAWAWYLLAQHPYAEQRLHHEVTTVLGGRRPELQDLPNLVYTRMVIEEAMRLYPPGWMTWRTAIADDQLDGYHIPAGAKVVISPYVTHRLPSLWDHPEAFDPDRFTPAFASQRHRYAYIPFGAGPRMCIGSNLAMMEMQLTLAMVSQAYRLRLVPGRAIQPHPSITFQPGRPVRMALQPR